jgi:hypothetical protein
MAKFEIKMDDLKIDPREFSFEKLKPTLQRAMAEVLADHGRKAGQGKQPDGTAQKANSEEYAARKANPGIKVGSRLIRGEVPTILTSEMTSSRMVETVGNEVRGVFTGGNNAKKARWLDAKGYKIHYFSKQNIKWIEDDVLKALGRAAQRGIKVGRK